MHHQHRLLVAFILALTTLTTLAQDATTNQIVNLLNQARIAQGTPPLVVNTALTQAAQRHSDDMAAQGTLSHTGSDGTQFWQRIADAGYGMSTGGENVLFRWDADGAGAFSQWQSSPGHNANMMNPDFFEVGVAYAPASSGGFYFTMVLASRPGMSPPAMPPTPMPPTPIPPTPIPPTNTPHALMPTLPVVTVLPQNTIAPLSSPTTVAPQIDPQTEIQAMQPRNALTMTLAILEGITRWLSQNPPAQIALAPTPTFAPTITLAPSLTPQPLPTTAPTATPIPPDFRLIYDEIALTLINVTNVEINVANLFFDSVAGNLNASSWNTEFLSQPLNRLPPQDCLQIGLVRLGIEPTKPDECRFRHAWILVPDNQVFWSDATLFNVRNGMERLTICLVDEGICDVSLLGDPAFAQSFPTTVPAIATQPPAMSAPPTATLVPPIAHTGADIRILMTSDGIALQNISGRDLDLQDIAFESDAGVFLATSWTNADLSRPLTAFPHGDCLQVWSVTGEWVESPAPCRFRHGWVAVSAEQQFWRNVAVFRVRSGATVLATCETRAPSCDVTLP